MNDDSWFSFFKCCNCDGCLWVAHINESYNSLILSIKVIFTEESIVVNNGSTLIDDSQTLDSSNMTSINDCLTLNICCIGRYRNNKFFSFDIRLLIELLNFGQIEAYNLFHGQSMISPHLSHLELDFIVFCCLYLMCDILLFNGYLIFASSIKS